MSILLRTGVSSLWRRLPLAAKLALPNLLLTTILALAGTYVVTRVAVRSANDRLTTALVEAVRRADVELVRLEEGRLSALRARPCCAARSRSATSRSSTSRALGRRPCPSSSTWRASRGSSPSPLT